MRRLPVLVVLTMVLAACGREVAPEAGPSPDGSPTEAPTECAEVSASEGAPAPVTMKDTFFDPPCVAASSTQTMILSNAGDLEHNFSVGDAMDIDVEPGEETETDPLGDFLAAGTYDFVCKYHQAQGMVGVLTVE
jgi:plastocyanin